MALRASNLVNFFLWLSILLFLLHEFHNLKFRIYNKQVILVSHSSLSLRPLINRKVLASKFDFKPFQHQQDHQRSQKQVPSADPAGTEIDPRYGVEKRLVPTGPNPLHH
ncbi:hypothetical protein SLE2022_219290 [Rubroshorea leprosula]|uniref:Uncharacterized protein n=1 Tax=Rubroshorea leprosula TaxID=152421 RepID=A0AAV5HZD4_9ROSI|nr:hypothetical protein SLEP1_g4399 [Rubroshorea leprosula]